MIFMFMLVLLSSCAERPTKVRLTGGNPPTFHLSGSGDLDRLVITEADAAEQPNPDPTFRWEIVPVDRGPSGLGGSPVEKIREITYGIVPEGYRQTSPPSGTAPKLVAGKYYSFEFSTVNAPHAWGYLVINNGKAEFARIHGNCIYEKKGVTFKGPCGEPQY